MQGKASVDAELQEVDHVAQGLTMELLDTRCCSTGPCWA